MPIALFAEGFQKKYADVKDKLTGLKVLLGSGAYGTVNKMKDSENHNEVAVKLLKRLVQTS
jgi:hypothetical protein